VKVLKQWSLLVAKKPLPKQEPPIAKKNCPRGCCLQTLSVKSFRSGYNTLVGKMLLSLIARQ
jgi:hypothetical protein